jgi:glycosyltransferase involved in cell wall biosynthesis
MRTRIRCVLVDPSLYTGPYDAALTRGLLSAGVDPIWAIRPTRRGDEDEIPRRHAVPLFYKGSDDAGLAGPLRALAKGVSHIVGLVRLLALIARNKPDIVHVQWTVLPLIDVAALWSIRMRRPLILTVHDPNPYNGQRMPLLQRLGFDVPIRFADRVIVHTRSGRDALVARGVEPAKIAVIPHGPLPLKAVPQPRTMPRDARYTFVLFGEIKPYKGVDVLVEAVALLPRETRERVRIVVAGRPRMALEPILERMSALELGGTIEIHPKRLSNQEMADLFAEADCFVFPYREIDASGVYFLTKGLRKWIIASRVGVFAEDLTEGERGTLVASNDTQMLARALEHAACTRPKVIGGSVADSWTEIGHATRVLYEHALSNRVPSSSIVEQGAADA